MLQLFADWKPRIVDVLRGYLENQARELGAINEWGDDVCGRLLEFTAGGKMIRGGLIIAGAKMFGGACEEAVYGAAAAMELLQSSFLIHDDIMDRDETRRGAPTIYAQYIRVAQRRGLPDPARFGDSHAICAGDVAFFFAFDLLSRLQLPADQHRQVLSISNKAVMETCIAQMQDVYFGSLPGSIPVREEDVLQVYHYKTGRYTFTLPLQLGAVLAGAKENVLAALEGIGEVFGLIFQIKDDEIGLFGESDQIGKPVGSDIEEGKKTLFYAYLYQSAAPDQRRELAKLFGSSDDGAVQRVRDMIEELGVRRRIQEKIDHLTASATEQIAALPGAGEDGRRLLRGLLDYNLQRAR